MDLIRDLPVTCDGSRLICYYAPPESARGTAVLLHGIPELVPDPTDEGYAGFAKRFVSAGWMPVWGDMRAARSSEGFFSIEGWVRDASAIVEAAASLAEATPPVVVVGSSAGGAVAAEAIRRGATADALALLAAPASWVSFAGAPAEGVQRIVEGAGMRLAPEVLADPTEWAAEFDEVATEVSVSELNLPILVMHGTADDVVPPAHAPLIAAAAPRSELVLIEGAGHQLRRNDEAVSALLGWLEHLDR